MLSVYEVTERGARVFRAICESLPIVINLRKEMKTRRYYREREKNVRVARIFPSIHFQKRGEIHYVGPLVDETNRFDYLRRTAPKYPT